MLLSLILIVTRGARLAAGLSAAVLELAFGRRRAVAGFRVALQEMGLPRQAVETLVRYYPRWSLRMLDVLTQGEDGAAAPGKLLLDSLYAVVGRSDGGDGRSSVGCARPDQGLPKPG